MLFYGMIAERIGRSEDEVSQELFRADRVNYANILKDVYPELKGLTFQVAVDRSLEAEINEQTKEIALLPPFAGG